MPNEPFHRPGLTPEQETLLWTVRMDLKASERNQALDRILHRGVDWPALRADAVRHRLLPLLYQRIKGVPPGLVPEEEQTLLRGLIQTNAIQNLRLTAELFRVVGLLREAGIPCLAFKGPTLAQEAHGSVLLRQFMDLDLLVSRSELRRASEILGAAGYAPYHALTPGQREVQLRSDIELTLTLPSGRGELDLHWGLVRRYRRKALDPEAVFRRARTIMVEGREVLTLSIEDLLLYLCAHGAVHLWSTLGAIHDLACIATRLETGAWAEILEQARRAGLRRTLLLGLLVARETTGMTQEPPVTEALERESSLASLQEKIAARLFGPETTGAVLAHELDVLQIGIRDTRGDQLRYGLARVFYPAPEELQSVHLPGPLAPLHFVIRPFYAVRRFVHRLGR